MNPAPLLLPAVPCLYLEEPGLARAVVLEPRPVMPCWLAITTAMAVMTYMAYSLLALLVCTLKRKDSPVP